MTGKKNTSFDYSAWARLLIEGSEEEPISKLPAGLYVVATPIGNLGDITLRGLRTLAAADVVACEDTRVTGALLHRYGLKKPLLAYHDHNAEERRPEILAKLNAGKAVALVSDAGTPLISDPGYKLVQACRESGYLVTAVPGASALLTALVSAGLPTDRFLFAGFLPSKATAQQKALEEIAAVQATLVFYEAPSRLAATLAAMEKIFGGARRAVVVRELTKMFEELRDGTLDEMSAHYGKEPTPKGEIVIIVGSPVETQATADDIDTLLRQALRTMSVRDAAATVAEATGAKKKEVYERALIINANPN